VFAEERGIGKLRVAIHHFVFDAKVFQCSQHCG
jgi:hypothetical protein